MKLLNYHQSQKPTYKPTRTANANGLYKGKNANELYQGLNTIYNQQKPENLKFTWEEKSHYLFGFI